MFDLYNIVFIVLVITMLVNQVSSYTYVIPLLYTITITITFS